MNENKFSGKSRIYSRFRPSYPGELIDWMFCSSGMTEDSVIADIGSGTGKLTKQLLEKGCRVYAVEPNPDMRSAAQAELSGFENFVSVSGTAENTALDNKSVDHITAAQAFHWFDKKLFKEECRRILKAGGRVLLIWNCRDIKSNMVAENELINRKYCPDFNGFSGGMNDVVLNGSFADFFDADYKTNIFEYPLSYSEQEFIGRNLSSSYALKKTDDNYEKYINELKALFNKYSCEDIITVPNYTICHIGAVNIDLT